MARIPYVTDAEAGDTALVDAIRTRRGGKLLKLDRQLLHSPPFAQGWNALLGAVRSQLQIDPRLRELALVVVAVLTGADYEIEIHAPEFVKAGGTDAQAAALLGLRTVAIPHGLFDELDQALIALATQMTRTVDVEQSTFDALQRLLGRPRLVELIGIVAAFNMVTRFIVALAIEPESQPHPAA